MRIVIDNPMARVERKEEKEIPNNEHIRFECHDKQFIVRLCERGIIIHESTGKPLAVHPIVTNKIEIR